MSFNINISQKIYWFYPKYETLFAPNQQAYWNVQTNRVDVYIDASNFIESMIKPDVQYDDDMAIVAGLVNLAIHYRKFYLKHFKTYSRIFIVWSTRENIYNKTIMPEYDSVFENLYRTLPSNKIEYLRTNLNLLSEICKYLKDIYFVQTNIETAVKIRSLITKYSKDVAVAIYSKDAFMCQIPAITPNAVFFKITKNNSLLERIETVTIDNALFMYMKMHRRALDLSSLRYLSSYLYSILLALTNCKERNIVLALSPKQAISVLYGATYSNRILNNYPAHIEDVYNGLSFAICDKLNSQAFINRFKALDIISQQAQYDLTPEANNTEWMIDITNNEALKDINDKYFIKTPLNIDGL